MTSHLVAFCFEANDPLPLAHFWARVLGWRLGEPAAEGIDREDISLLPGDDTGFRIRFRRNTALKIGHNRMHFDLTSTSDEDQQQTVATLKSSS